VPGIGPAAGSGGAQHPGVVCDPSGARAVRYLRRLPRRRGTKDAPWRTDRGRALGPRRRAPRRAAGHRGGRHPRGEAARMSGAIPEERAALARLGFATRILRAGTGAPVVLLHGNPDNAGEWRAVLRELGGAGRAIAPDLPGFGAGDEPPAS